MYGAQACLLFVTNSPRFENDVEMYGAQAELEEAKNALQFENDVEMYGAQAHLSFLGVDTRLRMM